MFELRAEKTKLTLDPRSREQITSGSANVYRARFEFSGDWDGLTRVAVFRVGVDEKSVLLDDTDQCTIPWEVLQKPMALLQVGVYGTRNGNTVLPTIWTNLGTVLPGASPGEASSPPTPDLWEQALARKQDKLTGLPGQIVGFDADGSAVPQDPPGGGEGGTTDHRALIHREDEDAHPIGAITHLERELAKRVTVDDALSVTDIIKIMEG